MPLCAEERGLSTCTKDRFEEQWDSQCAAQGWEWGGGQAALLRIWGRKAGQREWLFPGIMPLFPPGVGGKRGWQEEGSTLSGKQGGCFRQLVSQLTPVMKETRAAGSGLKSRSWSISWPHCMNMSERSWSGVSCSVGKRTMSLETARACGTPRVRARAEGPRGRALPPLRASAHQGHPEAAAPDPGRPAEGQRDAVLVLGGQPARKGAVGGPQRGAASAGEGQGTDSGTAPWGPGMPP